MKLVRLVTTFAVLGAVLALMAVPASAKSQSGYASWKGCPSKGGRTVFRFGKTRVFVRRIKLPKPFKGSYIGYVACDKRFGRTYQLPVAMDYPDANEFSNFATAGRFLAFAQTYGCGACSSQTRHVQVFDLKFGRGSFPGRLPSSGTPDPIPECQWNVADGCQVSISRIFVRTTGSVVYSAAMDVPAGLAPAKTVNVIAKHEFGARLRSRTITHLDTVQAPDLATLTLSGRTAKWTSAGQPKSASVK